MWWEKLQIWVFVRLVFSCVYFIEEALAFQYVNVNLNSVYRLFVHSENENKPIAYANVRFKQCRFDMLAC